MKPLPQEQKDHFRNDDLIVWLAYKEAKALCNPESASAVSQQPGTK
jgi:hypothetical protein